MLRPAAILPLALAASLLAGCGPSASDQRDARVANLIEQQELNQDERALGAAAAARDYARGRLKDAEDIAAGRIDPDNAAGDAPAR